MAKKRGVGAVEDESGKTINRDANQVPKKRRVTRKTDSNPTYKTDDTQEDQDDSSDFVPTEAKAAETASTSTPKVQKSRAGPKAKPERLPATRKKPAISKVMRQRADANKKCKTLKEDNEGLKSKVKSLQLRQLAHGAQDKDYVQDDQTIMANVRKLFKLISDWIARWARKGYIMEGLAKEEAYAVAQMLGDCHDLSCFDTYLQDSYGRFMWLTGGPRLAASIHITDNVLEIILADPFHFLYQEEESIDKPSKHALKAIYEMMDDDAPEKSVWTAQTLRALYRPQHFSGSIIEPIDKDQFKENREKLNSDLITELLCNEGAFRCLLNDVDDATFEKQCLELRKMLEAAQKLSLQLWAQDVIVDVNWQHGVVTADGFRSQHEHFEPHVMMQLEDDDVSLDGKRLDRIVRPLIEVIRLNTKDGEPNLLVAAKMQGMVFLDKKWRPNKKRYEEAQTPAAVFASTTKTTTTGSDRSEKQEDSTPARDGQVCGPSPDKVPEVGYHVQEEHENMDLGYIRKAEQEADDECRNAERSSADQGSPPQRQESATSSISEFIDLTTPVVSAQTLPDVPEIPELSSLDWSSGDEILWGIQEAAAAVVSDPTADDRHSAPAHSSAQKDPGQQGSHANDPETTTASKEQKHEQTDDNRSHDGATEPSNACPNAQSAEVNETAQEPQEELVVVKVEDATQLEQEERRDSNAWNANQMIVTAADLDWERDGEDLEKYISEILDTVEWADADATLMQAALNRALRQCLESSHPPTVEVTKAIIASKTQQKG